MLPVSCEEDGATQFDALYKVLLVGDEGSGASDIFDTIDDENEHITEVGDDYKVRYYNILDLKIKFEIWNTGKHMVSRRISDAYYINSRGVLLVYDTSNRSAFINMRNWYTHIKNKGDPHIQIVLVGHSGMPGSGENFETKPSVVSVEEGCQLASELGISFCAVKAGNLDDVQASFLSLYRAMGSDMESARMGMGIFDLCVVM